MSVSYAYPDSLARHYDQDYAILRPDGADIGFYGALADEADGEVLEVACGTGRVLLPLARARHRVTGVDPTESMLASLRAKLAGEPAEVQQRVSLLAGHFGAVDLPRDRFGLVYSAFRAFQHLETADAQRAALRELARLARPGGLVAFDAFEYAPRRARAFANEHQDYTLDVGDERHERRSRARLDPDAMLLRVRFRWLVDGRVQDTASITMRICSRDELLARLSEVGLELVELYADFARSPWCATDPRELVVVARKPLP